MAIDTDHGKRENDERSRSRSRSPDPGPPPVDDDWGYNIHLGVPPGGYQPDRSIGQNLVAIATYSVAVSAFHTWNSASAAWERQRRREAQRLRVEAEERERRERERREALERHMRDLGIDLANQTVSNEDISAARASVGYQPGACNIVIAGSLNAGKSSLINALRDRSFGDDDYAPTGASEVTQERHRYVDPLHDGFVWYDTPGAGTVSESAFGYYQRRQLYAFDLVVLAHESTLTQADVQVLQVCHALRTRWISVRTKKDMHIGNFQLERSCSPTDARELFIREVDSDVSRFRQQGDASATGFTDQFRDFVVSAPGIRAAVRGEKSPTDPVNAFIDEIELLSYMKVRG